MSTSKPVMEIPAKLVKELRERTNAGFSDCRAALVEAAAQLGDTANTAQLLEKAIEILRKKGQAAAAKKATREASEGLIGHYIHAGGKIGVIVEINCESDFVARTEAFQNLCHDVAMHIAAVDPRYVRREDVTPEMLEKEREIYMAQARATGKPGIISPDKVAEARCSAWLCDSTRAAEELGFVARTPLEKGLAETLGWYKEAGWLRY